ncbi:PopZ family protein [Methylobacterium marchantiae]|uniref:PopZ family protein n=1 Tax=Methylobacterium marchantiae TaxID=600331 RepID=A0ABW3WWX4_9HYPH
MEEILASIRRIIADDQNAKAEVVSPVRSAPPQPENDDVLDLAEVAQPRKPQPAAIEEPEIGFAESGEIDFDSISFDDEPEPLPPPVARQPEPPRAAPRPTPPAEPPRDTPHERLISAVTDASVGHAFQLLAGTMVSQNARTIEDMVQDMLRPMLKSWLDDNLPGMVERLVRAEIERVARGR